MDTQADKLTKEVNDINSIVNSYYIIAEALDMFMAEMERQLAN